MKKKLISAAVLSCCLLFTSCGDEMSIASEISEKSTSVFSSEETESESIEVTSEEDEVEEESTSLEEEEVEPTAITESIEIIPINFTTSYVDDDDDFSGVELHVFNVLYKNKTINDVATPVAQFKSNKTGDAGCLTTTKPYTGINSIIISQAETGYDGYISVLTSTDGVTYTEVTDSETESTFEYSFDLDGATYFKITNGSSTYALYLTSITLSVD